MVCAPVRTDNPRALTKYVEGYIVFVFPSIRPFVRPCVRPVLTFYIKVLRDFFFIHQEMALAGGIREPLGTCSRSRLFLTQQLKLRACDVLWLPCINRIYVATNKKTP